MAYRVPGFTTTPAEPGAQSVQAAMDALPVTPPVVEIPKGHGVQDVELARAA